jgi:hypothetical protein
MATALRNAAILLYLAPAVQKAAPGSKKEECAKGARVIEAAVWNKLPQPQTYGAIYVNDMNRQIGAHSSQAPCLDWLYPNRGTLDQVTGDDAYGIFAEFLSLLQQTTPLVQKCDQIRQSIEPVTEAREALDAASIAVQQSYQQMIDAYGSQQDEADLLELERRWHEAQATQREAFHHFRTTSEGAKIKGGVEEYEATRTKIAAVYRRLRRLSFAVRYEFPVRFGEQAHRLLLRSHNLFDFTDVSIPKRLVAPTAAVVVDNGTDEAAGSSSNSTKRAKTDP